MNFRSCVVLMSGGVDSSVAAYALKEKGFRVHGISLKLFEGERHEAHLGDAKRVAEILNISHEIVDVSDYFRRSIINYFLEEYRRGRTPNPCTLCNKIVKVKIGLEILEKIGFDYIATGHYARVIKDDKGVHLKRALWAEKSQEYYLALLDKESLKRVLFPLGELSKEMVRNIAAKLKLPVAEKPESQEICFIDYDYRDFLKIRGFENLPGLIKDEKGNVLGTHDGYYFYTIGQRRGLGVAKGQRLYVKKIIPENNTVILGERESLMGLRFTVVDYNFIEHVGVEFSSTVRVRYRGDEVPCKVYNKGDVLEVYLEKPLFAITPGQVAVFYEGENVLGGGIINEVS